MHQARDLLQAIIEGRDPEPSFADGLQVQRVLAAVERSAENGSVWTPVEPEKVSQENLPLASGADDTLAVAP